MRRRPHDPHDDPPPRPRRSAPPSAPASRLDDLVCWVWVYCTAHACNHRAPMAIAPLIIRWGTGVSSDRLRRCARCTKCGHKGAMLIRPSWVDSIVGFQPFPVERR